MGLMGKLKFWNKDKPSDLGNDLSDNPFGKMDDTTDFSNPVGNNNPFDSKNPFSTPPEPDPAFSGGQTIQSASSTQNSGLIEKDLEVISSKLDMLRASLDSVNQRLINVEKIAVQEQEQMKKSIGRW